MQRCQRFYIRACLILLILGMSCSELEEEDDLTGDLKLRRLQVQPQVLRHARSRDPLPFYLEKPSVLHTPPPSLLSQPPPSSDGNGKSQALVREGQ
jgi:hypothetical protein